MPNNLNSCIKLTNSSSGFVFFQEGDLVDFGSGSEDYYSEEYEDSQSDQVSNYSSIYFLFSRLKNII